ncbi:MAG: hypothetical protein ACI8QI_002101 [Limisphaerales bacterium]|jgi:hypothetical protein
MLFAFSLSPALSRWERGCRSIRGSVVECGSLHRFGSLRKAAGTAALQDAPATRQPGLAKRVALGSFSLREKVAEGRMRVNGRMFF